MQTYTINAAAIAQLDADGPAITSEANALDIIAETFGAPADLIVIPVARLGPDFLNLRTGLLGAVLQKFTTYNLRVAFLGDISNALANSKALRDFVGESNRHGRILFAPDVEALATLLA
jgi:hypothetical protein